MSDYFAGDERSNRERMLAGELYIADDPDSARIARRAARLSHAYHQACLDEDPEARSILEQLLGSLGPEAVIRPPLFVDYGENIHIGARTFINFNLTALDVATITIGADCQIGPNLQLLTPTHPLEPGPRRDKLEAARPITLADNVWLGGGVIICPGVSIGQDSVIGAGAVVTNNIPAGVLATGTPARVIKDLSTSS